MGNIKKHINYALCSLALGVAIIFSVQFFVSKINKNIESKKLAFIQNLFSQSDILTNNILTSPKFYKYFLKYADSMIEKALDFKFFPRNELDNFAFIMLSLPQNLDIKNFEIEKDYIAIELENATEESANNFAYNLSLLEKFKEVSVKQNFNEFSLILMR